MEFSEFVFLSMNPNPELAENAAPRAEKSADPKQQARHIVSHLMKVYYFTIDRRHEFICVGMGAEDL